MGPLTSIESAIMPLIPAAKTQLIFLGVSQTSLRNQQHMQDPHHKRGRRRLLLCPSSLFQRGRAPPLAEACSAVSDCRESNTFQVTPSRIKFALSTLAKAEI